MVSVAQLVERWIVAPVAVGSSPITHPYFWLQQEPNTKAAVVFASGPAVYFPDPHLCGSKPDVLSLQHLTVGRHISRTQILTTRNFTEGVCNNYRRSKRHVLVTNKRI